MAVDSAAGNSGTGCNNTFFNLSFCFEKQNFSTAGTATTNQTNFVGPREFAVWYTVSMVCCAIGSLMCITLLLVVWDDWKQSLRKITEDRNGAKLLIVHATVIEMFVCLYHFVTFTQAYYARRNRVSPTACIFIQAPFAVCRTVGFWSSAYLAFNRLVAICFPLLYRRRFVKYFMNIGVIIVMWLISFGIYMPVVAGWGSRFEEVPPLYDCGVKPQIPTANLVNHVLSSYTPLSITGFLYIMIIGYGVYQRMASRHGNQRAFGRRPFRLAMILLVAALWHCVCFFLHPAITVFDRTLVGRYPQLALWLRLIFMMGYVGNSVVFFGMKREYRSTVQEWTLQVCRRLRHGAKKVDPSALNISTKVQSQSRRTRSTTD